MRRASTTLTIATALTATIATAALALAIGPKHITTATRHTGDPALATIIAEHAPPGSRNISAFILQNGQATFAGLGSDEHTEFEIGSITKTFTAELLTRAVERQELTLDTTVGEIIETTGAEITDVTLKELATHTSGLPRLAKMGLPQFFASVTGGNPYADHTREELLDAARDASLTDRGEVAYSNFGFALLGQLIAEATDTPYPTLIKDEILTPLGMEDTYLMTPGSVPDHAPRGLTTAGRASSPWEMDADAPAGALRSTAQDMAIWADHVLASPLPEYTWFHDTGATVFHNGGTGGFMSMLLVDAATDTAAFAITDTNAGMEDLGRTLLDHAREGA